MTSRAIIEKQFSRLTEEEWRSLAADSIGVRSIDDLATRTESGLIVAPIYRRGDRAPIDARGGNPWTVVQRIDDGHPGAAITAMAADAAGGAGGIELVFANSPIARGRGLASAAAALPPLLAALPALLVRIEAGEDTLRIVAAALEHGSTKRTSMVITASFDPIATLAVRGFLARPVDDIMGDAARLLVAYEETGTSGAVAIADGRPWNDGGASDVEELGTAVAAFVAHLRALAGHGVAPAVAARRIGVALAADADQFLTIAKFRAMRLLLDRLLEISGAGGIRPPIHAETAWRMMGRRDAAANMLRATSAVFAAGVGGADSITVLPPSLDKTDAFARRMARNTQTILVEESGLARIADPGAGSGAIEALTEQIAAAAWDSFRAIEAGGGLLAAVRAGTLQSTVAASRDQRLRRVATRAIELVGINVHCPPVEAGGLAALPPPSPTEVPAGAAETAQVLAAARLAEAFERASIRAASLARDGRPPRCLVVSVGPAQEVEAVAADVRDVLASGGIAAAEATVPDSTAAAAVALEQAGTPVAFVCAGDLKDGEPVAIAGRLAAAGARFIVLATGKPVRGPVPSPFNAVISTGSDVPALLSDLLDAIADAAEKGQNR